MALYFHLLKYLQTIIEENSRHSYFFPWSPGGLTRNDRLFDFRTNSRFSLGVKFSLNNFDIFYNFFIFAVQFSPK